MFGSPPKWCAGSDPENFTSYRLKVSNSLGSTDNYTHPWEVSNCRRHISSSCPVFKALKKFAAASPGRSCPAANYTLWISFCVFPSRVGRRGCLSGHSCSSQLGNARQHGQQSRACYSDMASVSQSRSLVFCPGCSTLWRLHRS